MKALLNAIHDVLHNVAHILLIVPIAVLKAVVAGLGHVLAEIEKV